MPFNTAEAVQLVQDICRNEQVRCTVREVAKASLAVCFATAAGGLLFGPFGLAAGAAIAGVGAAVATHNKFVPLPVVLANMPDREKRQLTARVERIAQNLNVTDVAALGLLLAGNVNVRGQVVQELITFISEEMQVSVMN